MKERILIHIILTIIYTLGILYMTQVQTLNTTEKVSVIYLGFVANILVAIYYVSAGMFKDNDDEPE